jgi:large subunit ribosomal protein L18e
MNRQPTNEDLRNLIRELKTLSIDQGVKLWKRIAIDLEKPNRKRRVVNISKINTYSKEGEIVIVPGKVLGTGKLEKNITIAAYAFSNSAKDIIEGAKGKAISIRELMKKNPKANKVRILG